MSAYVCKCKFFMSASKNKCGHADIKIYKITTVITYLYVKPYFVTNKHNLRYKL